MNQVKNNNKGKMHFDEGLLPTWLNQRNMSWLGYVWIWVGLCVVIATFQYCANAMLGGLRVVESTLVIMAANLVLGIIMTFTGDIGVEHGLPFAAYLRAPFGYKGVHIAAISRGVVAAGWFGVQSYLGAIALNGIVAYLTGFDFWPLWYVIFMIFQIGIVILGIKAIERLATLAAPIIIGISIWMYMIITDIAATSSINIWTFAAEAKTMTLFMLFIINMSGWGPMALDTCNLLRWVKVTPSKNFIDRNKSGFMGQLVTLPLVHGWIVFIGGVSFAATGMWNPIEVIQAEKTGFILIALLVLVVLAQSSTNVTGAVLPAALTFMNAGRGVIGYKLSIVLSGVVGTLFMPWKLLENIFVFLGYYGGFLGAIAAIMICDYFVIRKRRLNVPELFRDDGQYKYSNGYNGAALVAFLVPSISSLFFTNYAYIIGLVGGFVLYLILMKTWILPKYKQAEIESNFSDDYLATSVNMNWVFNKENESFSRVHTDDLPDIERVV